MKIKTKNITVHSDSTFKETKLKISRFTLISEYEFFLFGKRVGQKAETEKNQIRAILRGLFNSSLLSSIFPENYDFLVIFPVILYKTLLSTDFLSLILFVVSINNDSAKLLRLLYCIYS